MFGVAATVTTAQQSTPSAASSCVWTGRLQAGPDQIPTFRGQQQSGARAGAAHHRACAVLTNTMSPAVSRRGRCFRGVGGYGALCALTFELSGRRRQDAKPGLAKMYRVPPDRAWWPAVGAPLERGVRQHCCDGRVVACCPNAMTLHPELAEMPCGLAATFRLPLSALSDATVRWMAARRRTGWRPRLLIAVGTRRRPLPPSSCGGRPLASRSRRRWPSLACAALPHCGCSARAERRTSCRNTTWRRLCCLTFELSGRRR